MNELTTLSVPLTERVMILYFSSSISIIYYVVFDSFFSAEYVKIEFFCSDFHPTFFHSIESDDI